MLASVAGAYQLGMLEPAQLQHLQAQLARLHDEFADAITSGSEFQQRTLARDDVPVELRELALDIARLNRKSEQEGWL